jgi:hypothetical protein
MGVTSHMVAQFGLVVVVVVGLLFGIAWTLGQAK